MKTKVIFALIMCLAIHVQAPAQEVALSTNMADYIDLGTLNMAMSYALSRHWSAEAIFKYNPFSYSIQAAAGSVIQNKQRALGAGARFWPWHVYSGWWLSLRGQWQEYNRSLRSDEDAVEGDRWGGALSGGYSYMLSKHLNLEVGAGVWAGYGSQTRYACPRCGRIVSSDRGTFVLPSDVILAVSYIF